MTKNRRVKMDHRDLKKFINIPTLQTDRLKLRRITREDYYDVFAYTSDPKVPRYLLWDPHKSVSDTKRYLSVINRKYNKGEFYDWGIEYEGRIIGTVGFPRFFLQDNRGEIGYVLSSKFWGMGIATEAVKRVIKYGFETLSLNRIEIRYLTDNKASLRVAEKCGMTYEGTMREAIYVKGRYRDLGVAAITAEEYFAGL